MINQLYNNVPNEKQIKDDIKTVAAGQVGILRKLEWMVFFRVFDLTLPEDREKIEKIYTRDMNDSVKGFSGSDGLKIFSGTSQFCHDNIYRAAIRWGEWRKKEGKESE